MAKWQEGRYSSHYLRLAGGKIEASINWSTKRDDEYPYRVRVLGNDIGGAKTLEAAKKYTEMNLKDILSKALTELAEGK